MKEKTVITLFWIIVIGGMILILCFCGCTQVHQQAKREIIWTQTARETAHLQFQMTVFQVSALKAYMAERMDELPANIITAIDRTEQLAMNYDPETVTDAQLGEMYGLRAKIFCGLIKEIVGNEFWRRLSL